jgi:hypothetical protein
MFDEEDGEDRESSFAPVTKRMSGLAGTNVRIYIGYFSNPSLDQIARELTYGKAGTVRFTREGKTFEIHGGIPPRPFISDGLEANKDAIKGVVKKYIRDSVSGRGGLTPENIGETMVRFIQESVRYDNMYSDLHNSREVQHGEKSPSEVVESEGEGSYTYEGEKNGDTQLVDTGELIDNLEYRVVRLKGFGKK